MLLSINKINILSFFFLYCSDSLELDESQAAPVVLILNEAIPNSIKYPLSGGRKWCNYRCPFE